VVILEEASRLDEDVFTEVIVPLLGVQGTAVIGISTPLDADNFYTQMVKMQDPTNPGKPLFRSLTIELACAACRKQAAETGESLDVCPHRRSVIPPWKSDEARNMKIKQLMSSRSDMYQREHLGISTDTDSRAFEVDSITTFAKRRIDVSTFVTLARHVFMAIDTCGGGSNAMAIVAGMYTQNGTLVILSVDTVQATSDTEVEQELSSHVERLRERFYIHSTTIVSIIEANYGGWVASSRVASILARQAPMRHVTSDRSGMKRPGCWTTAEVKERARIDLSRRFREERICFAKRFYTSRVGTDDELVEQLRRMRYDVKCPRDAHGAVRRALTGKRAGGGSGGNDDLAMALCLLVFFSMLYEDRPNETGVDIRA
jgi:hypothetical protein